MPRLTADKWAEIKAEFESNPKATFSSLAGMYDIKRQAIHGKSKKEKWIKPHENAAINDGAYRRADTVNRNIDTELDAKIDKSTSLKKLASREESEEKRAGVIVQHRQEWEELNNFRRAALTQMKEALEVMQLAKKEGRKPAQSDKDMWWIAKIAADTSLCHMRALECKQTGERKAWGLEQINNTIAQPDKEPLLVRDKK